MSAVHQVAAFMGKAAKATGGTISYTATHTIHTFTSSGTFTALQDVAIDYLIVGGGGGGSSGGGGGGGVLQGSLPRLASGAHAVTVGTGGAGASFGSTSAGTNGNDSVFNSLTAVGGGGGGGGSGTGSSGGSGGGGGNTASGGTAGAGTAGQGYDGGTAPAYTASGGGGAGALGGNGVGSPSYNAGNGGVGIQSSITGSATYYAGGGGGGREGGTQGTGGSGGGGLGSSTNTASGSGGTNGLGGGGGGGGGRLSITGAAGGNGGSGVVIISYKRYDDSSLLLDFAGSQTVDPRITFTRASTATRINASGAVETVTSDTPRIDYDPVTLACKGLLIEESRTNLLTYSEQFDNAAWTKSVFTVTANATTAPDVTITADKLDEATTASTDRYAQQVQTISASASYTASVCLKAAERSTAQVRLSSNNGTFSTVIVNVNLSAGTIGSATLIGGAVSGSATISALQNGWYRVSVTGVLAGDVTIAGIFVYAHNGTTTTYAGVPGSGFYTWGAQLEAGAFATSYIPTTSAQVTRAADAASMTGTNFSSWYRQDEGTFVVAADTSASAGAVVPIIIAQLTGGADRHQIIVYSACCNTVVSGVGNSPLGSNSSNSVKIAFAYKSNDFAASISGVSTVTDTSGSVPLSLTYMVLGRYDFGGATFLNGHIAKISYFPSRLVNATLQALSTP